jgi:hypothetical protein
VTTYSVVRRWFEGDGRLLLTGLTLEEAQTHCRDDETSGSTATEGGRCACHGIKSSGPNDGDFIWFDGYEVD